MQLSRLAQIPRLARLFVTRLLDQDAAVVTGEQPIGPGKNPLGKIALVVWGSGFVTIRGHHSGDRLTLGIEGQPEHDFSNPAFEVRLPRLTASARVQITCRAGGNSESLYLAPPTERDMRRAHQRALPHVLWKILREWRGIAGYLHSGDPNVALGVRQRLGLADRLEGTYLPTRLFGATPAPVPKHPPTIVLPIHDAFDDTDRLLTGFPDHVGCPHHLVLVDDASDDPRITNRLDAFAKAHSDTCTLLRLPRNLGFVGAANAGLKHALDHGAGDVVLLNSDTIPPEGWGPRLLAPMTLNRNVASVTPMSNAAEILSIPLPVGAPLPSQEAIARIDSVARTLAPGVATAELPTGIGFCMAMSRDFLKRIGTFDPAFGPGYGEEVDWCRKARKLGGRNIGLGSLFVGHRGGASFGSAEKSRRIEQASAEISRRYPGYDGEVQAWCRNDPLAAARLALTIAWLGAEDDHTIPIYFGHSLGGGAETALMSEISHAFEQGCPGAVILRVGGPRAWRVEVRTRDHSHLAEVSEQGQVLELLRPLRHRKIIYSCGVGAQEPATVPRFLLRLVQPNTAFEMRLHDFFPLSPSWNLLDSAGRFRGVPPENTRDPAHRVDGRNPLIHRDWRLLWRAVIGRAQTITAFSPSSAALFAEAYPEARDRIVLRPHPLHSVPEVVPPGGRNLGILGSVNRAKGAGVVTALGNVMRHRRIYVIGEMDGRFQLAPPHAVHGAYKPSEISRLAKEYGIGAWIIPSVCPETFSYTTREALATGLPVLAFDLGAQADALRDAPNGHLLPYAPDDIVGLQAGIEQAFAGHCEIRFRSAS